MPDGLPPLNELATAQYSDAHLDAFPRRYELPRQAGTKWDYSNIGYSLLGKALAARSARGLRDAAADAHRCSARPEQHWRHVAKG